MVLSFRFFFFFLRRQRGQSERKKKERTRGRGRQGAGWLRGERGGWGGEDGCGSAGVSTSAPAAGLGSGAAVPVLVLRVLPGPGSRGKSPTRRHVLRGFPQDASGTGARVLPVHGVALWPPPPPPVNEEWGDILWRPDTLCPRGNSCATCVCTGANGRRMTSRSAKLFLCFCAEGRGVALERILLLRFPKLCRLEQHLYKNESVAVVAY